MNVSLNKKLAGLLLASLSLLFAGHAASQETFPTKPIKIIVPTTAGSSSDVVVRMVAEDMGRRLGQPLVIENRAGAGGAIGAEAVARSPADGYTLLAGSSSVMVMLPATSRRKLPYDPDGDFVPVGRTNLTSFVLVVSSKSNFQSLADLVKAAKAQPGNISYASAGSGTNAHLFGEMLSLLSGTNLTHVPYKGPGPAQVDVLGGVVDMQIDTTLAVRSLIKSGRLRALAVTGAAREALLPEVPTVTELGYPQLTLTGWTALYAPRGTPNTVVLKLQSVLKESLQATKVQSQLVEMGNTLDLTVGDALLRDQRKNRETWSKLADTRGISLD